MGNDRRRGRRLPWFAFGVLTVCAIGLFALAAFLYTAHGLSAREEPSAAERWIARRARKAAVPADAANRANPVPDTPEVQAEARAHWADHCASCHANDGSGESLMGRRTYPPAPDMRRPETQQMTDGELFYVIQNGVRLTAMPAWGKRCRQFKQRRARFVEARAFHSSSSAAHVRREEGDGEAEPQRARRQKRRRGRREISKRRRNQ